MEILRDTSSNTRILVLLRLLKGERNLSKIAREIDVTPQAVSSHLTRMSGEGLVRGSGKSYSVTTKGVQFVHERLGAMKGFVDLAYSSLPIIQETKAMSRGQIRKGQDVTLSMRNGVLTASRGGRGPSRGTAFTSAGKGEMVLVGDLEGIVQIEPGRVTVAAVPFKGERRRREKVSRELARYVAGVEHDRLGCLGTVGSGYLRAIRRRPNIEFAVVASVIEASRRGLSVLVVAEQEQADELVRAVQEDNRLQDTRIPLDLVNLG